MVVRKQRRSGTFINFQAGIHGGSTIIAPLVEDPLAPVTDPGPLRRTKTLMIHSPAIPADPAPAEPFDQFSPRHH